VVKHVALFEFLYFQGVSYFFSLERVSNSQIVFFISINRKNVSGSKENITLHTKNNPLFQKIKPSILQRSKKANKFAHIIRVIFQIFLYIKRVYIKIKLFLYKMFFFVETKDFLSLQNQNYFRQKIFCLYYTCFVIVIFVPSLSYIYVHVFIKVEIAVRIVSVLISAVSCPKDPSIHASA
jgi:hypothetical protein